MAKDYFMKITPARRSFLLSYLLIIILILGPVYLWFFTKYNYIYTFIVSGIGIIWLIYEEVKTHIKQVIYLDENGISERRGIFNKTRVDLNYKDILRTTATEKFPFGRIFKYGDLMIDAAGMQEAEMVMKDISNPNKIKDQIDAIVDEINKRKPAKRKVV